MSALLVLSKDRQSKINQTINVTISDKFLSTIATQT